MTALWILLGVAAVLTLLLLGSVTIYVRITDEIRLSVGAFGYRRPVDLSGGESEQEEAAERKKKSAGEKAGEKAGAGKKKKELAGEKPSERSLADTVELVLLLVKSFLPGSVRLLSHLRFTGVRVYMTVAGDEADRTAILCGAAAAGVYNLLAVLDRACTLRVKSVDVVPDFVSGEAVYDISFKVKLRFGRILGAGIGMLFKFLANLMRGKNQKKEAAEGRPAA